MHKVWDHYNRVPSQKHLPLPDSDIKLPLGRTDITLGAFYSKSIEYVKKKGASTYVPSAEVLPVAWKKPALSKVVERVKTNNKVKTVSIKNPVAVYKRPATAPLSTAMVFRNEVVTVAGPALIACDIWSFPEPLPKATFLSFRHPRPFSTENVLRRGVVRSELSSLPPPRPLRNNQRRRLETSCRIHRLARA